MKQTHRSLRNTVPSLHGLTLFEASARHLNFSKAAEELAITQPAVSHGIRQLEAALGQSLFVRERRALRLTAQGERLFAAVSRGLATIAETVEDIARTSGRDTVVVCASTAMATEWLLPRLRRLRTSHPGIAVDIRCLDHDPNLSADGIDVHLRLGDGSWPGCDSTRLWPEAVSAVCSPGYLAANRSVLDVGDLRKLDLIHYVDPYRLRIGWSEWLRGVGAPAGMPPASLSVNDNLLALRAAENGEGVVLGWRPVIDRPIAEGRLVPAFPETLTTDRAFYACLSRTPGRRRHVVLFHDWLVRQAADPPERHGDGTAGG